MATFPQINVTSLPMFYYEHLRNYRISVNMNDAKEWHTMDTLKNLLERTRSSSMSSEQREQQRQSFAYGNTKFENDRITRATVDRASKELAAQTKRN